MPKFNLGRLYWKDLLGTLFLVVLVGTTTYFAANPAVKQLIGSLASGGKTNCADIGNPNARKKCYLNTTGSTQANLYGPNNLTLEQVQALENYAATAGNSIPADIAQRIGCGSNCTRSDAISYLQSSNINPDTTKAPGLDISINQAYQTGNLLGTLGYLDSFVSTANPSQDQLSEVRNLCQKSGGSNCGDANLRQFAIQTLVTNGASQTEINTIQANYQQDLAKQAAASQPTSGQSKTTTGSTPQTATSLPPANTGIIGGEQKFGATVPTTTVPVSPTVSLAPQCPGGGQYNSTTGSCVSTPQTPTATIAITPGNSLSVKLLNGGVCEFPSDCQSGYCGATNAGGKSTGSRCQTSPPTTPMAQKPATQNPTTPTYVAANDQVSNIIAQSNDYGLYFDYYASALSDPAVRTRYTLPNGTVDTQKINSDYLVSAAKYGVATVGTIATAGLASTAITGAAAANVPVTTYIYAQAGALTTTALASAPLWAQPVIKAVTPLIAPVLTVGTTLPLAVNQSINCTNYGFYSSQCQSANEQSFYAAAGLQQMQDAEIAAQSQKVSKSLPEILPGIPETGGGITVKLPQIVTPPEPVTAAAPQAAQTSTMLFAPQVNEIPTTKLAGQILLADAKTNVTNLIDNKINNIANSSAGNTIFGNPIPKTLENSGSPATTFQKISNGIGDVTGQLQATKNYLARGSISDVLNPSELSNFGITDVTSEAAGGVTIAAKPGGAIEIIPLSGKNTGISTIDDLNNFASDLASSRPPAVEQPQQGIIARIKTWYTNTSEDVAARLGIVSPAQRAANEEMAAQIAARQQQQIESRLGQVTGNVPQAPAAPAAQVTAPVIEKPAKPSLFGLEWNGFTNSEGKLQFPIGKVTTPISQLPAASVSENVSPPIKPREVFDPNVEVQKILKQPSADRPAALADFKAKLGYQQQGMVDIQNQLTNTITNNPDVSIKDLKNQAASLSEKYGLVDWQKAKLNAGLDIYNQRHTRINEIFSQYPDANSLFEAMFGEKPLGNVSITKSPMYIDITLDNTNDYALAGQTTPPTKPTSGRFLNRQTLIPDSKGLVVVEYGKYGPPPPEIEIHESQHAINSLLKELGIFPKSSSLGDLSKVADAISTNNSNEIGNALQQYLIDERSQVDIDNADEILAYLKGGAANDQIFSKLTRPLPEGGSYDFYSQQKSTEQALLGSPEISALYPELTKIEPQMLTNLMDKEYNNNLISDGLDAFNTLVSKGYSRDNAIAILEKQKLADWPKTADRIPLVQTAAEAGAIKLPFGLELRGFTNSEGKPQFPIGRATTLPSQLPTAPAAAQAIEKPAKPSFLGLEWDGPTGPEGAQFPIRKVPGKLPLNSTSVTADTTTFSIEGNQTTNFAVKRINEPDFQGEFTSLVTNDPTIKINGRTAPANSTLNPGDQIEIGEKTYSYGGNNNLGVPTLTEVPQPTVLDKALQFFSKNKTVTVFTAGGVTAGSIITRNFDAIKNGVTNLWQSLPFNKAKVLSPQNQNNSSSTTNQEASNISLGLPKKNQQLSPEQLATYINTNINNLPNQPSGLTSKGAGPCQRVGNSYCDGQRMYGLYLWYKNQPDGWWNKQTNGNFTPADFLAMMLTFESRDGSPELLKSISVATSNQLWGSSIDHQPYCTTSDCEAGIFNFLGAYVQSAGERYNGLISNNGNPSAGTTANLASGQDVADTFAQSGLSLEQIANNTVYNPVSKVYNNDVPTQWGAYGGGGVNDPDLVWISKADSANAPIGTTNRCGVYYVSGPDVVYTNNQKYNWGNLGGYPCK